MRVLLTALSLMVLAGCSTQSNKPSDAVDPGYVADTSHPSLAQNERVRFLVLHYTALDDANSLKTLTGDQVSAHYLVPSNPVLKDGKPVVYSLVPEEKRAWHAGVSNWHGRVNLNDSSIGIEIVNLGFTQDAEGNKTWYPYGKEQMAAVTALTKDLVKRYAIAPQDVLAHSDVAPQRKYDPGPYFPWAQLATAGVGAWPEQSEVQRLLAGRARDELVPVAPLQDLLRKYGYDATPTTGVLDQETRRVLSAFQMHFRPSDIAGNADAETEAILKALLEKYRGAVFTS